MLLSRAKGSIRICWTLFILSIYRSTCRERSDVSRQDRHPSQETAAVERPQINKRGEDVPGSTSLFPASRVLDAKSIHMRSHKPAQFLSSPVEHQRRSGRASKALFTSCPANAEAAEEAAPPRNPSEHHNNILEAILNLRGTARHMMQER